MLIVLSPAKDLSFGTTARVAGPAPGCSIPRFAKEAIELIGIARRLSSPELARLMHLSPALADLNHARFQAMIGPEQGVVPGPADGGIHPDAPLSQAIGAQAIGAQATKEAIFAFNGDVYQGLKANTLSHPALRRASDQLRILSGLYGLLRPFDLIEPHRLEMGTRLKTPHGTGLYSFWGDRIARQLDADAAVIGTPFLLNLASQEYFAAVDRKALTLKVITIHFRDVKDGDSRTISFFAKRARGEMARHVLESAIDRPEGLKDARVAGYRFAAARSTDSDWVFERPQPEPVSARARSKSELLAG